MFIHLLKIKVHIYFTKVYMITYRPHLTFGLLIPNEHITWGKKNHTLYNFFTFIPYLCTYMRIWMHMSKVSICVFKYVCVHVCMCDWVVDKALMRCDSGCPGWQRAPPYCLAPRGKGISVPALPGSDNRRNTSCFRTLRRVKGDRSELWYCCVGKKGPHHPFTMRPGLMMSAAKLQHTATTAALIHAWDSWRLL